MKQWYSLYTFLYSYGIQLSFEMQTWIYILLTNWEAKFLQGMWMINHIKWRWKSHKSLWLTPFVFYFVTVNDV